MSQKRKVFVHKFAYDEVDKVNELLASVDFGDRSQIFFRDEGIMVLLSEEKEDYEIKGLNKEMFFVTAHQELQTMVTAIVTHKMDLIECEQEIADIEKEEEKQALSPAQRDRLKDAKRKRLQNKDSLRTMSKRVISYTQLLNDIKSDKVELIVEDILKEETENEKQAPKEKAGE